MKLKSNILKLALFATGLSGIVAEYILSTLATYFLGDSVFQWTMIVSIMLFSMGLGSRLSKYFNQGLLKKFIIIEFVLSILTSFSSLLAYTAAAYTPYTGLIIYGLSILIGLLIGMEIPLVVRLNNEFESLKVNISSVLENDYYGSLLGGVFFAFVGLPYLGLTYTPFVLGSINFIVASCLMIILWKHLFEPVKLQLGGGAGLVSLLLLFGFIFAKPIILYGEQHRYKDKVVYSEQSKYQKIVITQWKNDFWLFINGNQQLSTVDEVLYHEPLVHPVMSLHNIPKDVLVLGGGDGCAAREVLKYPSVEKIKIVDLDPLMTELANSNPILLGLNEGALEHPKVEIVNSDAFIFLEDHQDYYDVIIVDLPDPKTVELGRLYSREFYLLCARRLRPQGLLVTQAGSPYYAWRAFHCVDTTLQSAGFSTLPLHNQIVTLGEWGWILATQATSPDSLMEMAQDLNFEKVETRWLNQDAMQMMTLFGKDFYNYSPNDPIEVNTIHNPVLYKYYLNGKWDLY